MGITIGVACIAITNATVQLMMNTESVSKSIMEERSAGVKLEVQYSIATNPARIQDAAAGLGMQPDPNIKTISAANALNPELAASWGVAPLQEPESPDAGADASNSDSSGNTSSDNSALQND